MKKDIKQLLIFIGGVALGVIFMIAYQQEHMPQYTIDYKALGKIESAKSDNRFFTIETDKGTFYGIDFDVDKKISSFKTGRKLYELYVVSKNDYPGIKTNIGQVEARYGCEGCGSLLYGGVVPFGFLGDK